ncbi:hypothetical protein DFQ28_001486 [Apophysomyces sp. BC1034]|nr:hypothetical protein DFQ30_001916 [Apophysomyces sp. BC1015]KAG0180169.1 hypothetical protein DFQ29_001147 [Apophysomyces sp. BC1021]KAG0190824.1 hypothetical protein DFQ28_001486 [Apophysomyces sp. BC1034]
MNYTMDTLFSTLEHLQKRLEQFSSQTDHFALGLGVISTLTLATLYRNVIYNLYLHPLNKIPGPPVYHWIPFSGNIPEIFRGESGVPHKQWAKKYGGILNYHGPWNRPRLLVTDGELLKQILTTQASDFAKSPETVKYLTRFLGDGLLVAEGELHRQQRKLLNPAFSVQAVRDMVPLMAIPGIQLRNKWIACTSATPTEIDVSYDLSLATLDVIGMAGFGQEFRAVSQAGGKLTEAYMSIFSSERSLMDFLGFFFPLLRKIPTQRHRELWKQERWLDEGSREVVEKGMARTEKASDLLALMVDQVDEDTKQGMTVRELQNQCLTFLAAGHETTSVALTWCLWLLAQNPEIQKALREEITPVFDNIDFEDPRFNHPLDNSQWLHGEADIPSYNSINDLELLNNVCKETLRLIPPVPTTNRFAMKDTMLGNYFIPKGSEIYISTMVNHHSTEIWGDDAEVFRPSRWNEERAAKVGPYLYMPFLAGIHQCIGYKFALMEMKVLLALAIKDFEFAEKPGMQIRKRQSITLRPADGMPLLVTRI